jgi:hypothetical protein
MPRIVANPMKRLLFDLENSTVTKAVWDEDNNLVDLLCHHRESPK